jgi:hypothetical protein
MLQNASIGPYRTQRMLEAPTIVPLDLSLPSALYRERLAEPHLTPSLAGRMGYDRVGAFVLAGIPLLIPRVYAVEIEVCAVGLDVESGDHSGNRSTKASE